MLHGWEGSASEVEVRKIHNKHCGAAPWWNKGSPFTLFPLEGMKVKGVPGQNLPAACPPVYFLFMAWQVLIAGCSTA
jgi:hypothetical protein